MAEGESIDRAVLERLNRQALRSFHEIMAETQARRPGVASGCGWRSRRTAELASSDNAKLAVSPGISGGSWRCADPSVRRGDRGRDHSRLAQLVDREPARECQGEPEP